MTVMSYSTLLLHYNMVLACFDLHSSLFYSPTVQYSIFHAPTPLSFQMFCIEKGKAERRALKGPKVVFHLGDLRGRIHTQEKTYSIQCTVHTRVQYTVLRFQKKAQTKISHNKTNLVKMHPRQ